MTPYPKIHLSLSVSDLARSIDFYERFFGEKPVKIKTDYAKFLPSFAPINLAIEAGHGTAPVEGRVSHMGIQVADRDTVLAHLAQVKAAGLPVVEEIGVTCCYADQDKFWVEDPDGAHWEVYVLNRDTEERGEGTAIFESGASVSACCNAAPSCCTEGDLVEIEQTGSAHREGTGVACCGQ